MSAVDRLDQIEARAQVGETLRGIDRMHYAVEVRDRDSLMCACGHDSGNSDGLAEHRADLMISLVRAEVEDLTTALREANDARADLLAHIERCHDAIKRVKAIHEPVDALNVRYGHTQKVCTGCGTDDGNWQHWPCPTVQAVEDALGGERA